MQDVHLDGMLGQLRKLKNNNTAIGNEVDTHNPLLVNLDKEV